MKTFFIVIWLLILTGATIYIGDQVFSLKKDILRVNTRSLLKDFWGD